MSLTSIISSQEALREGLRARTVRPSVQFGPIKAPPLTENYGVVGTAFDYLFRFRLQRINSTAQTTRWVAEQGVEQMDASEHIYDLDNDAFLSKADRQRRKADKYIAEARAEHRAYLKSGTVTDKLLIAALRLAYLDVSYRVGQDHINWQGLKAPNPTDVADLQALLDLIDESNFKANHICLLNPTFGQAASQLVGGADADLFVDDVLIDIKTTKAPGLDSRALYQLVGYYLLHGFDGLQCGGAKAVHAPINFLGIYYSRYGYLWKVPVGEILSIDKIGETAKWFFESVCESKSQRLKSAKAFRGPLAQFVRTREEESRTRTKKRATTKRRKKLMSSRRSRADARKRRARG